MSAVEESKEVIKEELKSLIPDADVSESDGRMRSAPLKAKLFQLQKKLEKELKDLQKQKEDMIQALAKAKMKLIAAQKVYDAAKSELDRVTPEKIAADFEVVRVRAALEVVIRASRRTMKFNDLERQALYAQIKFIKAAAVLRARIVGEKPHLSFVTVEELEQEALPESITLLSEKKDTVLSEQIKQDLTQMLKEAEKRLKELDEQDLANSAEIKRLQAELKKALERQTTATTIWRQAKANFKKAERDLAKMTGMYNEMKRIFDRDIPLIDDKIRVIMKELKLVKAMMVKIDNFKG